MSNKITKGNVFDDLGFDSAEAENLRIRSTLMRELVKHIKENKYTQKKAAKIMFGKEEEQPRISDLCRGKIDKFTIDILVNMLSKAGISVALIIDNRLVA